jgi:hypothetical protein
MLKYIPDPIQTQFARRSIELKISKHEYQHPDIQKRDADYLHVCIDIGFSREHITQGKSYYNGRQNHGQYEKGIVIGEV